MNSIWGEQLLRAGKTLSPQAAAQLHRFLDLLLEANQRINLTRITDRPAAEIQHVADALTLARHIPAGIGTLSDIGSGGGVPGLPLAIVLPDVRCVLIESTKKKAEFLKRTVSQLGLSNVEVVNQRAETAARGVWREHFDVVTARAVGSLAWLAEWCLPLTRVGGKVLAMKGQKASEELAAAVSIIRRLGGAEPVVHPVELPGAEHHVIIEIAKTSPTDPKYPRDPTTTRGKPLVE